MTKPIVDFKDYADSVWEAMETVDKDVLRSIVDALKTTRFHERSVYVCGNGGSAAIANHLVCDCMKGVGEDALKQMKVVSLSSNMPLVTAIANDIGYDDVFSKQLEYQGELYDMLIAISSSGNSPNIIKAINKANEMGMITVAIAGFDGGAASVLAKYSVHIKSNNYGVIEDVSQSVMHFIAQTLRRELSSKDPEDIKY